MSPFFGQPAVLRRIALSLVAAVAMITLAGLAPVAARLGAQPAAPAFSLALDSVGMTVADLDRAVAFYTGVLGFEQVSEVEVGGADYEHLEGVFGLRLRVARLRLGDEHIELMEFLAPQGRPIPVDARSNDLSFQHVAIIVRDMDEAYAVLRRNKVQHASSDPQRLPDWNPNAGGIKAFYFKDPDNHPLEILEFPPDKGDPKWHRPTDRLFLGIDHTAIAVGETQASLRFYRDALGLSVAGSSENYGTEQEHLNNVFGAHLLITSLRPASGPAVELLHYLTPRDGRPAPADERANDVIHRQTRLVTSDLEPIRRALQGKYPVVSTGVVELPDNTLGFRRGLAVRDPDGHVIQLVEP